MIPEDFNAKGKRNKRQRQLNQQQMNKKQFERIPFQPMRFFIRRGRFKQLFSFHFLAVFYARCLVVSISRQLSDVQIRARENATNQRFNVVYTYSYTHVGVLDYFQLASAVFLLSMLEAMCVFSDCENQRIRTRKTIQSTRRSSAVKNNHEKYIMVISYQSIIFRSRQGFGPFDPSLGHLTINIQSSFSFHAFHTFVFTTDKPSLFNPSR